MFMGRLYAGHRTRFLNLEQHTADDPRISATYRPISGWVEGGLIERLPLLPKGAQGRVRAMTESLAMARWPRPDAIWTSSIEAIAPMVWTQKGPLRRPLILDLDSTVSQLEDMSEHYFNRPRKNGLRLSLALALERIVWDSTAHFLPWSNWAASGLRQRGVPDAQITVLPPGVDLAAWHTERPYQNEVAGPMRILFVGGDFIRKGGDLLIDVVSEQFVGRCELDIVTRDSVSQPGRSRLHRAEANSPELRSLYARADIFVLPTQAECFGIACIEAMASGLPIIMSNVGGAPDIVEHGETGWLIEPTRESLTEALERALAARSQLASMGRRARERAVEKFDGAANDRRLVDCILDQIDVGRYNR
jgi:glycosyltransferase involved in cell wall biosynthesis